MKTTIKYICTGLSLCACTCLVNNLPAQAETTNTAAVSATETGWDRQSIMEVARRVADWQIKDYPENKYAKSEPRGWIAGALYMGMFDWAELSGDNTYYDWLRKIFNRQSWQVANRMYHADDVCIAQTYIDFYNKEKNENMLKPTIARADWVLNNPSNGSMDLDYSKGSTIERWTWCDALFMAPGVYTRLYTLTGNRKYMHFADSEFRATYNHLYDKDEDLFYRDSRYIGQKEANGKKIFWGRGNGWVIGGLAEILKTPNSVLSISNFIKRCPSASPDCKEKTVIGMPACWTRTAILHPKQARPDLSFTAWHTESTRGICRQTNTYQS